MATTTVIHIKSTPKDFRNNPDYVYIGRPSLLGNPFPINSQNNRDQVVRMYRAYAQRRMVQDPAFKEAVEACRGKKLVCYCAPQACHGDVIAELLERGP